MFLTASLRNCLVRAVPVGRILSAGNHEGNVPRLWVLALRNESEKGIERCQRNTRPMRQGNTSPSHSPARRLFVAACWNRRSKGGGLPYQTSIHQNIRFAPSHQADHRVPAQWRAFPGLPLLPNRPSPPRGQAHRFRSASMRPTPSSEREAVF